MAQRLSRTTLPRKSAKLRGFPSPSTKLTLSTGLGSDQTINPARVLVSAVGSAPNERQAPAKGRSRHSGSQQVRKYQDCPVLPEARCVARGKAQVMAHLTSNCCFKLSKRRWLATITGEARLLLGL
ncbi:hypothetical protein D3C80_1740660 [compost metagenome]